MTLQEQLDEALAARHKLLTGTSRVAVGWGDRRVEYTAAKLSDLDTYIAGLRRAINGKPAQRSRIRYVVPD